MARTFTAQVEALAKLRSGGKQQVEVRYVYVDARGGQNVIATGFSGPQGDGASCPLQAMGGGGHLENEVQPYAPARLVSGPEAAGGVPVWSPDTIGHALHGSCDPRPEALQDARRTQSRSSEGSGERGLEGRPILARASGQSEGDAGACSPLQSDAR